MIGKHKNQRQILDKLNIPSLNEMQEAAQLALFSTKEVVLLSPTGTGKTIAFLLPLIAQLDTELEEVQLLIIVPSRELASQIEQVAREMGTGYKIVSMYGGQSFNTDRQNIKHRPAILIGTPGRVADHLRRSTFSTEYIKTLVLDEFDKSLEVGFEGEMSEILDFLPALDRKILTSATQGVAIPAFVKMVNPVTVDYLHQGSSKLEVRAIISPEKDKLDTLVKALAHLGNQAGIIFCNFKDTIARISDYLNDHGIPHGTFYGGMEQWERELNLLKFRNGSYRLLLATDLAARGIDVPELDFILHYHLPIRLEEFTHRNGRTARMNAKGTAYVLHWRNERLPDFMPVMDEEYIHDRELPEKPDWVTLSLTGGRKDKISKGDIAGFFFKEGGLAREQLGTIEVKNTQSFVAVKENVLSTIFHTLDNKRLKKAKIRLQKV